MQVRLTGWRHFEQVHRIVNADISYLKVSKREPRHIDEVDLSRAEDTLIISAGIRDLHLTGNFCLEIQLTTADIVNLAAIALSKKKRAAAAVPNKRPAKMGRKFFASLEPKD